MGRAELGRLLKAQAYRSGFELAGIAPLRPSGHREFLQRWLAAGHHGEMAYLARPQSLAQRVDPAAASPELRSALVVAHNYYPEDEPGRGGLVGGNLEGAETAGRGHGVIARYARGRDYHRVMRGKLKRLLRWLEAEIGRPLPAARVNVDTGPVLERELASLAGLGWFGRNTMLINPRRGSYFFLGVLLLELELQPDPPFSADRCGSCRACIDACPTGALLDRAADGAPVMDARRCISYLTIELRGSIPRELRPALGNRVFGCDICQSCCPWNAPKFVELTKERDYWPEWREARDRPDVAAGLPGTTSPSLVELMRMRREEWDRWTRGSALRRAGYAGLKRNVAVALGNWASEAVVPILESALHDEEAAIRGHAAWALGRIGTAEASRSLEARLVVETDGWVRREVKAALEGGAIRSRITSPARLQRAEEARSSELFEMIGVKEPKRTDLAV